MPVIPRYGFALPEGSVGPRRVVANPTSKAADPPIQGDRWARNGMHPDVSLVNAMNGGVNASVLYRSKQHFAMAGDPGGGIADGGAGTRDRWRFAMHTGPYQHALCAIVVMGPPQAGYNTNSYGQLTIRDGAGATVTTTTFEYGASPTGSSTASGWQYMRVVTKYIEGLSADTDYFGTFADVAHGNILCASVFDLQSMTQTGAGYLPQNLTTQSFILDAYRQNQAEIMRALWRRSAGCVVNWTVDDGTAPRTIAGSAAAQNVADSTVTTVSAASPGYTLNMTGRDRLMQASGVPMKMWAYGKVTAGTGGQVDIKNSSGASIANITGWGTTASWRSTTFNMPASSDKYDLQMSWPGGAGFDTFSLYAITFMEYET